MGLAAGFRLLLKSFVYAVENEGWHERMTFERLPD